MVDPSKSCQTQIAQLSSPDRAQQASAAEALARMGEEARPAAVVLVRAMRTDDAVVREWCAAALEELGPPPALQIQDLIELTRDSSPDVAYWAITLLGRAGDNAAPAVATLTNIVRSSPEMTVRERAAWALGKLGPLAAAAAPALHEAAAGDAPRLNRLAKNALEAIAGR